MDDDRRLTIVLKEAEFVQAVIARFDGNGLTIKSWCLPTWSAITVYAIEQPNPLIALLGLVPIIGFGFTEFIYRCFQIRFVDRAIAIEKALNQPSLDTYRYSLNQAVLLSRGRRESTRALKRPQFAVYYGLLLSATILVTLHLWFLK